MDNYRDYFTREELLRTLQQAPYTPGMLGSLGIFETVPLGSTNLAIEIETKEAGRVLTAIARGAPRQVENLDKRSVVTFSTQSFGDQGAVMADEVLNARAVGPAGAKEVLENRRAKLVAKLRRTIDYTHEKLRMNVLTSPATTEFGAAASSTIIAVQTTATKLRQEIFNKLTLPIEAALDGLMHTGIVALCSDGYWSDLIEATSIKETYLNQAQAAELRGAVVERFEFGGVTWARYRGTSTCKIPDNQAIAVPTGVPETFFQAFAPNDTLESVGSGALGQPYYMGSKELKDSQGVKGWEVSIQSHPKMICGRPACIIPITKT
jgi:Phage major capsid protein E